MTDEGLKVGDLVKLRSGGHLMTVTDIRPSGYVRCQWFAYPEGEAQLRTETFPLATLRQPEARRQVFA